MLDPVVNNQDKAKNKTSRICFLLLCNILQQTNLASEGSTHFSQVFFLFLLSVSLFLCLYLCVCLSVSVLLSLCLPLSLWLCLSVFSLCLCLCLFHLVLGVEPRASRVLGKRSSTELHTSPPLSGFAGAHTAALSSLLWTLTAYSPGVSRASVSSRCPDGDKSAF